MVLDGTSLKSFEVRPIGSYQSGFPSAFIESASFYIKLTVYENERINLHHCLSLPGSEGCFFP